MRTIPSFVLLMCCWVPLSRGSAAERFEWQTAVPESQGLSSEELEALKEELAAKHTAALLVIRNDKLVLEWYAEGRAPADKHYIASTAKALVGGLSLALAVDDGLIALDDPAWKYVPAWKDDPAKSKITVRHLGTHSSGLDEAQPKDQGGWRQTFWERRDPPNDPFSIGRDSVPVVYEPGTDFEYSNPGMGMLSWCVTASLKGTEHEDVRTLLRERIMRPIGVEDDQWQVGYGKTYDVDGLPLVANWGGGNYTARAIARVGRLMLRRGDWQGRPLIRSETVELVTAYAGTPLPPRPESNPFPAPAMGWYNNSDGVWPSVPRDAFCGAGAGNQALLVVPSRDLIVVRQGGLLGDPQAGEDFWRGLEKYVFTPVVASIKRGERNEGEAPGSTEDVRHLSEAHAPYPPSEDLLGVEFNLSTHRTLAKGSDIWPITWADDGHQYTSWGDGGGFGGTNSDGRVSFGVARVEGDWDNYRGVNIWGGKNAMSPATFDGKGTGILCVDGVLYLCVARPHSTTVPETWIAVSHDHARTWQLADWHWTMHDGVFAGTFLNFGRNYAEARDDYVYVYFTRLDTVPDEQRNWIHEVPGRVDLARVPKDRILDRGTYEWFAGLDDDETPTWTPEMASRKEVFEDPAGIKIVSVCYQPRLGKYLLVYNPRNNRGNFGLFEAPQPWGPWRTVSYLAGYELFMPPEENNRVSVFHFAPKWWSADGREFTLVFNTGDDAWNTVRGRLGNRE